MVAGKPVLYTYVDFLGGTPPNFYIRVMYQELSCLSCSRVIARVAGRQEAGRWHVGTVARKPVLHQAAGLACLSGRQVHYGFAKDLRAKLRASWKFNILKHINTRD